MMVQVLDIQLKYRFQKTEKNPPFFYNRKSRVRKIANISLDILAECVINILHEHMQMKEFCVRWVLRFLTK